MISVRKRDVPEYLQKGELYHSLVENNDDPDEELTFPENVLKPNTTINDVSDCERLLNSLRFWSIESVAIQDLVNYVLSNAPNEIAEVLKRYEVDSMSTSLLRRVVQTNPASRMKCAIKSGSVDLVEALLLTGIIFPPDACDVAAEMGSVEMMSFLCANGCQWRNSTSEIAARSGNTKILRCMCEQGHKATFPDVVWAVNGGALECLRYLVSTDNQLIRANDSCLHRATVRVGNLSMVRYLLELRVEMDESVCAIAALYGQLECLQFAHKRGCFWDSRTCKQAAVNGHLNCLQYAHEHGCPLPRGLYINHTNPCYNYMKQNAV